MKLQASVKRLLRGVPDKLYLRLYYFGRFKKMLHLKNPQTFNEKLQWLKLNDRKPEYTRMVDKYEAKGYVAAKIGEEHIIPTLGVWDRFEDIDFDSLPEKFVLKCTHDSGGLVICRDKSNLDKEAAREKLERSLKNRYFYTAREWPYKNVKPRILAEQYMENSFEEIGGDENISGLPQGLMDYKFYCFNGEPQLLYISKGLEDHATASISFVTLDWDFAPYGRSDYKPFEKLPPRPKHFEQMLQFARELSKGTDFLRVDLYEIGETVYFSELTFSPCGGYMPFATAEQDAQMGAMLKLTKKANKAK